MASQKKYYYSFKSLNEDLHLVEIWQDSLSILTAEEIKGSENPFIVEMPKLSSKFQVIRGTGCEMNIFSNTSMKFFNGLYHVDKKEIIVKHYINGVINWYGYLNSELSLETYSELDSYNYQAIGNDGFALLDRIQFLADDGSILTGVKSLYNIIVLCLEKIGLPFGSININLSTTSPAFTIGSTSTILHENYIDCANFYQEDGTAETVRKVLESVLMPFGAFIVQMGGDIWITDVNTLAGAATTTNFNSYTRQLVTVGLISYYSWIYNTSRSVALPVTISSVGYTGTGSEIEISGGKNKQVVNYSPYPIKTWLPQSLTTYDEFDPFTGAWTWNTANKYWEKVLANNKYWDGSSIRAIRDWFDIVYTVANSAALTALTGSNAEQKNITYVTSDTGYHYRWNGIMYVITDTTIEYGDKIVFHIYIPANATTNVLRGAWKLKPEVVMPKSEYSLGQIVTGALIEIKGQIQILHFVNISPSGNTFSLQTGILTHLFLTLRVKIGSKYFNGETWIEDVTGQTFFHPRISDVDDKPIGRAWQTGSYQNFWSPILHTLGNKGVDGIYITMDQDLSGTLEIEWWSNVLQEGKSNWDLVTASPYGVWGVSEVRLSNLSVNVTQKDGNVIPDANKEYIGYLDPKLKDEADKIDLICGTMTSIVDRGKMLYLDTIYKCMKLWTRQGQDSCIETHLLNSLSSNYRAGYLTLSGMKLKNQFNLLNVFSDSYTASSKLMISSYKNNYRDNETDCDLIEIFTDELTIINT